MACTTQHRYDPQYNNLPTELKIFKINSYELWSLWNRFKFISVQ
jgi:hypothetical protein